MTEIEFSNELDVLVNSHAFQAQLGVESSDLTIHLNEYEKSVYLTQGQDQIVKELYSGTYTGKGFENTEELRRQLDTLIQQVDYTENTLTTPLLDDNTFKHITWILPSECWYIVFEQAVFQDENACINGKISDVLPVKHDDYLRIRKNPFRGPNKRRVLRLDNGNRQIEIVSKYNISKYTVRYIKKPEPIITAYLPDDVSVDGIRNPQTCKLPELLHKDILERAAALALQGRQITTKQG